MFKDSTKRWPCLCWLARLKLPNGIQQPGGHERESDEPGNVVIIAMFGCVNNDVHSYYTKQLHKHYQHGYHC